MPRKGIRKVSWGQLECCRRRIRYWDNAIANSPPVFN